MDEKLRTLAHGIATKNHKVFGGSYQDFYDVALGTIELCRTHFAEQPAPVDAGTVEPNSAPCGPVHTPYVPKANMADALLVEKGIKIVYDSLKEGLGIRKVVEKIITLIASPLEEKLAQERQHYNNCVASIETRRQDKRKAEASVGISSKEVERLKGIITEDRKCYSEGLAQQAKILRIAEARVAELEALLKTPLSEEIAQLEAERNGARENHRVVHEDREKLRGEFVRIIQQRDELKAQLPAQGEGEDVLIWVAKLTKEPEFVVLSTDEPVHKSSDLFKPECDNFKSETKGYWQNNSAFDFLKPGEKRAFHIRLPKPKPSEKEVWLKDAEDYLTGTRCFRVPASSRRSAELIDRAKKLLAGEEEK